jgi:hypothetical protein
VKACAGAALHAFAAILRNSCARTGTGALGHITEDDAGMDGAGSASARRTLVAACLRGQVPQTSATVLVLRRPRRLAGAAGRMAGAAG